MPGDLYGFAVIAGCIGSLIIGGAMDYRNHTESIEGFETCLEIALYLAVAPCVAGIAAMFYGDVTLMTACFLATLGAGLLWLGVALFYFVCPA
jgi:hypothetical protein